MKCPQCGSECERDEVDNGVGMEACGPWGCPECHWFEPRIDWPAPGVGGAARMTHENALTPNFLAGCTDMELVLLQHDLRMHPDDKRYLDAVLAEMKRRAAPPSDRQER